MTRYISLLRGINVSGHRPIKMKDLQVMYESLSCENVKTYIQSGNVVFSAKASASEWKRQLESAIVKTFTWDVSVFVCKQSEWNELVKQAPFTNTQREEEGNRCLVTFCDRTISNSDLAILQDFLQKGEVIHSIGKQIFLYCPNGYGKTKLANPFIEKKLGLVATTRNWKTIAKLSSFL
ncbi:MAG: DUF1697 domain-containing protein [Spirochaetota bacterium]